MTTSTVSPLQKKLIYLLVVIFVTMGTFHTIIIRYGLIVGAKTDTATIRQFTGDKRGTGLYGKLLPHYSHLIEINGEMHELSLQRRFAPGREKILWNPATKGVGVILDDEGNYSIVDVMGGWARLLLDIGKILLILYLITAFRSSFRCFDNQKNFHSEE